MTTPPRTTDEIDAVLAAVDEQNRADPNIIDAGPLALVQGQLASKWLAELDADASAELKVAARAHHLKRWELQRADYAEGRAGYLKWRRDNKAHQAASAQAILVDHGWSEAEISRVAELLLRTRLRNDSDTQSLEDAACLVFLETQFAAMTQRTERDHMVEIVAKTLRKMSPEAIALAGSITVDPSSMAILEQAVLLLD